MTHAFPLLPDGVGSDAALFDDNSMEWVTYDSLRMHARDWARRLSGPRSLVFLYIHNNVPNVAAILGAAIAGHVVALFDPNLSEGKRAQLEACYRPDWVVEHGAEQPLRGPLNPERVVLGDDLAVLLSTSGSTGSPKLVRLSWAALESNARAIAEVLSIERDDVAAGHLPLHYSYGLSVLTSHLCRGARVRLTEYRLMEREFWPALREAAVTHLPGVPFHYQIMAKLGFGRLRLDKLRAMTQAGGVLDVAVRHQAYDFMSERSGAFYVLYGQTEAAPRMTTLQHTDFLSAASSVGTALPGCRIEIADPNEMGKGEVIFYGPNVMLGYAENREDLALGDVQKGRLPTGDIGHFDESRRLFLTGRAKRAGKVYGLRVNLDELEREANVVVPAAVVQVGERLRVYFTMTEANVEEISLMQQVLDHLIACFTLPRGSYEFRRIGELPRTQRGKVDYLALEQLG